MVVLRLATFVRRPRHMIPRGNGYPRGALLSWAGGLATFVIFKYLTVKLLFGLDYASALAHERAIAWSIYTGAELLVAFAIFIAEGYISAQTDEERARVTALFARLGGSEDAGENAAAG